MANNCNGNSKLNGDVGRIGVVVCGFGRAGKIHTKNLVHNPRVHLLAIFELPSAFESSAVALRAMGYDAPHELLQPSEKFTSFLSNPGLHAVVVTTPTPDHQPLVTAALMAGKAVFCEKPLASTLEETKDLYKIADEKKVPLFCSLNRRFDPTLTALRNALKKDNGEWGALGAPLVVKTVARDHPLPPLEFMKTSGGMVHDCGIHDMDLVCWLTGALPDTVFTMGYCHDAGIASIGDVDTLAISMQFSKPKNMIATLDLCRHGTYGYDQRVEVLCAGGMLESQAQRENGLAITSTADCKRTSLAPILPSFPQRYIESYRAAVEHFLDLVQWCKSPKSDAKSFKMIAPPIDVIHGILVADAAELSLKTGKLVHIDWEKMSLRH